jgi:hypothetical protein
MLIGRLLEMGRLVIDELGKAGFSIRFSWVDFYKYKM